MGNDEEPTVSYSVKDLLTDMNRKLDSALATMVLKADSARVDAMEKDIIFLMNHVKATKEYATLRSQWRQWFIPLLVSAVLAAATIISLFH